MTSTPPPESPIIAHNRKLCADYFSDNPSARDGVIKAYYAFHAGHFRAEPNGHDFPSVLRLSACVWCNRTREQVRHDDLPAHCQMRPEIPDIAETIKLEEQRAIDLLDGAEAKVKSHFKDRPVNGFELAYLRQTHGIEGELSCDIMDIRFSDYESEYNTVNGQHSALSKAAFKPEVISVK